MIWLYPAAAIGLVAIAAPIVFHVLVRQRATRVPFPTLRFIQPHQLASVRRRALDDAALLAVRCAILTAAVAAVAGPFFVTASRQRAWDARTISIDVIGDDVRQGLIGAVATLDWQPPGRRQIVVRSTLALGSLTDTDVADIPHHIGLRFLPTGVLPASRTTPAQPVVEGPRTIDREVTLDGSRTSVRDVRARQVDAPAALDLASASDQERSVAALRASVARQRYPAPLPNRLARVAFGSDPGKTSALTVAWMADAAARIARASDASGLQFGADGNRLVVSTTMRASDARAESLVRAVAESLAPPPEQTASEIVPIPDEQLRKWSREPGPAVAPTAETLDRDDRRWMWALALALIAVETRLRRKRASAPASRSDSRAA